MATQSSAQRIQHIDLTKALRAPKREVYNHIGNLMVSSTQRKIRAKKSPKNSPLTKQLKGNSKPLQDTGLLMASINHRATDRQVVVGTNKVGARILHEGGAIRPKKAKSLAIPASKATLRMMRRYGSSPKQCIEGMKKNGWSVYSSKSGKTLMARHKLDKISMRLFYLRKSVTIPARPYLTITQKDRDVINKYVARMVVKHGK